MTAKNKSIYQLALYGLTNSISLEVSLGSNTH